MLLIHCSGVSLSINKQLLTNLKSILQLIIIILTVYLSVNGEDPQEHGIKVELVCARLQRHQLVGKINNRKLILQNYLSIFNNVPEININTKKCQLELVRLP